MKSKPNSNRREFLKNCSLLAAPIVVPSIGLAAIQPAKTGKEIAEDPVKVNFLTDGLWFTPQQYLAQLNEIDQQSEIKADYYAKGGPTTELEDEFVKATEKEKAVYFPTGSMANQVAIKLLNGENTKAFVPWNSHVFRDEADAAQSVHGLRLIPLGMGKAHYDLNDLKAAVDNAKNNEHYQSGIGTIVIENPVRSFQNTFVPIETIKEISNYCRENGYKLHLDGARLHIAAAFSGVSVKEYASLFDTVYISLYKYLNASGGAMLCGDEELMNKMELQIKVLGGSILRNWSVTAMALHYFPGIDDRWKGVVKKANDLVKQLNKLNDIQISSIPNGTNSFKLELNERIDSKELAEVLYTENNILWAERRNENGELQFIVNESLMLQENDKLVKSWKSSLKASRK